MAGEKRTAATTILMVALTLDAVSALAKVVACEMRTAGADAEFCLSRTGSVGELTGTLRTLLNALDGIEAETMATPLPPPPEVPKAVMDQLKQRGRL